MMNSKAHLALALRLFCHLFFSSLTISRSPIHPQIDIIAQSLSSANSTYTHLSCYALCVRGKALSQSCCVSHQWSLKQGYSPLSRLPLPFLAPAGLDPGQEALA